MKAILIKYLNDPITNAHKKLKNKVLME